MRLPVSLHVVAGCLLVIAVMAVVTDAKKGEKKEELKKPETNTVTPKPSIFGFIRRLLPEKTLEKLRAAVTSKPKPKEKSSKSKSKSKSTPKPTTPTPAKPKDSRSLKSKSKAKTTKQTVTIVSAKKTKLRSSLKASTTAASKIKAKPTSKKATTGKTTQKPKTPRFLQTPKTRQNDRLSGFSNSHSAPPTPAEMEVLTLEQKSSRLRQELIRETEDNCLAKILCGQSGSPKPKPKEKNTFVSDTAYLIKEFFNIFDFTIDEAAEKNKEQTKRVAEDDPSNDDDDDDDADEEDDLADDDDEEEDIYRTNPIDDSPKKNKYTMTKNKKNHPEIQKTRTSKPMTSYAPELETEQSSISTSTSTSTTSTTTPTTTTRRPKPVSVAPYEDEEGTTTMGDLVPIPPSTSKYVTEDRLGEYMTSTIISTSMTGSASMKPMGLAYAFPIKTKVAKDDTEDDDEEDDNPRYDDKYEEEDSSTYHRVTLEELVGDIKLNPEDFGMLRRGRSMKISLNNVTSDKYIQSKLKQMKQMNNEVKKLRIAQKVARSMREPRQCKKFSQVAEEVLQTCPLTTEVIRFFNTNLRNGTSIEVVKTPQPSNSTNGGGLVLLKNEPDGNSHAYFVDNHPNNANTKVITDLKNPSVPSSYGQEELQYPVYEKTPNQNPQNANLNQHGVDITKRPAPQKPKEQQQNENSSEEANDDNVDEDSDEDDDDEEEDDIRRQERDQEYDDEEQDDDPEGEEDLESDEDQGDDEDDDDNSTDDDASRDREQNLKKVNKPQQNQQEQQQSQKNFEKLQGEDTNQPNIKIAIRPKPLKRPVPPPPTLPPGVIRVYGVPTSSFDRDFSEIADKIGSKPVAIFGEEDIDRPAYNTKKKRRQLGYRVSKNAKHGQQDDEVEIENVAFSSRVPKHPPLETEPYVNDGDDDDDDTKIAYQSQKKNNNGNNGGKPLGGVKGGDEDDDDDDDKKGSSEKKKNRDKDEDNEKGSGEHIPPPSVVIDDPPFVPSMMYSASVVPQQLQQPQPSPHEYYHQGYNSYPTQGYQVIHHQQPYNQQYQQFHRPRPTGGYRPIVRPIKIYPGNGYLRPGRLYPLYG